MTMYNMLHGMNPFATLLLASLNTAPDDFGRFRDVHLSENGSQIIVLTRCGGGNRESYQEMHDRMAQHPLYVKDYDDDFDCTYAHTVFKTPKCLDGFVAKILEEQGPNETLFEKFNKAIEQIQKGTPEGKRLTDKMRPIMDQLNEAIKSNSGPTIIEV